MLRRLWRALKGKGAPSEVRRAASIEEVGELQRSLNEQLGSRREFAAAFDLDAAMACGMQKALERQAISWGEVQNAGAADGPHVGLMGEGQSQPSIALAMIVKNEAAILPRLIRSVAGLIDFFVVVDTGSTDDTMAVVRAEMFTIGVAGVVIEEPWEGFGATRTTLMQHARHHAPTEYLLLLDADHELMLTGDASEALMLTADSYMLRHDEVPAYRVPRLVRRDLPWRFDGSTHEVLMCDEPTTREDLPGWVVLHHCDGARRPEKIEDDRRLLNAEVARSVFYLAQTERDLGNVEAAAQLYERRAGMGGFDEEAYYALLQAGILRDDVGLLLRAWAARPARLEALYEVVVRLRREGRYDVAMRLLKAAGGWSERPDDVLFVHEWVWSWGLSFELSIVAFHRGDVWGCWALSEALLEQERLPVLQASQAVENARLAKERMEAEGHTWFGRPLAVGAVVALVLKDAFTRAAENAATDDDVTSSRTGGGTDGH